MDHHINCYNLFPTMAIKLNIVRKMWSKMTHLMTAINLTI